jgi:hypothetical protein
VSKMIYDANILRKFHFFLLTSVEETRSVFRHIDSIKRRKRITQ